MNRPSLDIAWLAGLVEGEGSFVSNNHSIVMAISSTDWDVIDKAARILDAPVRGPYEQHGCGTKPFYRVTVYGAEWPFTLFPFLRRRRRDKIKSLLPVWRSHGRAKKRTRIGYAGISNRVTA